MKLKILVLLLAVLVFYNWRATQGTNTYHLNENFESYYNSLTDAFLLGQLNLPIKMDEKMDSRLYDYESNKKYISDHGIFDLCFYKGKFYPYFGPAPVLTLYLPYQVLTGGLRMPPHLASLIFCFGGFVWAMMIILRIREKYYPDISVWIVLFCCTVLAFSNISPFLLFCSSRDYIYQTPICAGIFFLTGAIYFLCTSIKDDYVFSNTRLFLGSIFLGLSIASRPHFIFPALIALFFLNRKIFRSSRSLLLLNVPFVVFILLIMFYNFLRFDSPFEFGIKYQLSWINRMQSEVWFHSSRIVANIYFLIFQPIFMEKKYPFVYFNPQLPAYIQQPSLHGTYVIEKTAGIFPANPFLFTPLVLPLIYAIRTVKIKREIKQSPFISLIKTACWQMFCVYLVIFLASMFGNLIPSSSFSEIVFSLLKEPALFFLVFLAIFYCHLISFLRKEGRAMKSRFCAFEFNIIACGAIVLIIFYLPFAFLSFRYSADFATLLVLTCIIIWFYFEEKIKGDKMWKWITRAFPLIFGVYSIFLGAMYSLKENLWR